MLKILSFFIYTNIIVSLSAWSLYKITEILFNFYNYNLGMFVFFSTLLAYNYMRLPFFSSLETERSKWVHDNINFIYCVILLSLVMTIYLIVTLGCKFFFLISPVIFISAMYPIQIRLSNYIYNIRNIPLLKMILISLSWLYITLIVPLIFSNYQISYYEIDMIFQRFLFVLSICITFDIKDYQIDSIVTLPRCIGIQQSKYFAIFCLFIIEILLLINLLNSVISFNIFLALMLSIEISAVIIYSSNEKRHAWFYDIMVESLSIIMCLFVFFTSTF